MVLCVIRRIVKEAEISSLVPKLTNLFGEGEQVDLFTETLCFVPQNQTGNMNFINREVFVNIEYRASHNECTVNHLGAVTIAAPKVTADTTVVINTSTAAVNIRRMFAKAGFFVKADHAKKGLIFNTRNKQTIAITRPYNAALHEAALYEQNISAWTPLPGAVPFGSDYLLEISENSPSDSLAESTLIDLESLLAKLVA